MADWFDLITDKVYSPFFLPSEKTQFINRAQMDFVNKLVNPIDMEINRKGEKNGFEKDDITNQIMSVLSEIVSVPTDILGFISNAAIEAALPAKLLKIESILRDGFPARFIRANDYTKIISNTYLKPSSTDPIWRKLSGKIKLDPVGIKTCEVAVLRYPKDISIADNINCELPDICHNSILKIALSYTGISFRDEFLVATTK